MTASGNEVWLVRTDNAVERRVQFRGDVVATQRFAVPTGTAPNRVVLLAPGAGVYVSPRGDAAYLAVERDGGAVLWREKLFQHTFVLCAPEPSAPPDFEVPARDDDIGFGGSAYRFVVGALDGSLAVVDFSASGGARDRSDK